MKKSANRSSSKGCSLIVCFVFAFVGLWLGIVYFYHLTKPINIAISKKVDSSSREDLGQANQNILKEPTVRVKRKSSLKGAAEIPSSSPSNPLISNLNKDDNGIHVVFSTDCSFYQDWQTLLVFHSAMTIGQKGNITRIASGCAKEKQIELLSLYSKLFPQYGVHFTPDFKKDNKTQKKYDFYNKPYGVKHFLQYYTPELQSGDLIAIIDPDFVFLRPLTGNIAGNPSNIYVHSMQRAIKQGKEVKIPSFVTKGQPVAQLYGLGAPWTNDNHKLFNRREVCGEGSPCLSVKASFGEDHYSVGPPYILEKDDLVRLTNTWTKFVPYVYTRNPDLLAEMYAYSMAAAHENLPHFTMMHYMVSNTHMDEEGWPWIDPIGDNVCEPPKQFTSADGQYTGLYYYPEKQTMPTFLHYCQFFRAGEMGFQKRRIRKTIFECDKPMLMEPPSNLGNVTYKNRDGDIMPITSKQAKRNAFALNIITRSINAMIVYYKHRMCSDADHINFDKTINVVAKGYF